MKIVAINTMAVGSTGKIMLGIQKCSEEKGIDYKSYYGAWVSTGRIKNCYKFGYKTENVLSGLVYRLTGLQHIGSFFGTLALIRELNKQKPDIIHLHNLHLWVINVPMLFSYIKKENIKIVWTLHDCWSFTGQCPHYSMVHCQKWKTGCRKCPQIKSYPMSYVDATRIMWKLKREWFTGVSEMVLVTPSKWLETQVKESYLKCYHTITIYNGIDLDIFKPTYGDIYTYYSSLNKKIILGVAFDWGDKKGLDVFNELIKRLADDYLIILIGMDDKSRNCLDSRIIAINRTETQKELAEYYTLADVFVNPTRQEVLGLVNIEANACGTPVITFDSGGSPECINEKTGIVVKINDIDSLEKEIKLVCSGEKKFSVDDCIQRAKKFSGKDRFEEYVKLYERMANDKK